MEIISYLTPMHGTQKVRNLASCTDLFENKKININRKRVQLP